MEPQVHVFALSFTPHTNYAPRARGLFPCQGTFVSFPVSPDSLYSWDKQTNKPPKKKKKKSSSRVLQIRNHSQGSSAPAATEPSRCPTSILSTPVPPHARSEAQDHRITRLERTYTRSSSPRRALPSPLLPQATKPYLIAPHPDTSRTPPGTATPPPSWSGQSSD